MNSKLITLVVVLVVAVVIGGFWYWSKSKQAQEGAPTLGSEIFDKTQNTLEGQVPDANPFLGTETNPLKKVIKNPF